ncbi:hypothetical protein [Lacipirellula parvula]|uniref:Uncharacterized protein n=1 Tax=Lacipirellula parvula TaxID=2650471 RepID=A0A5K7XHB4_9BACT|nr:hypothetical protein [Lacipirellula parvula]BBO33613.1 hypothetical protein PLANPX_3225 [Lacipirellula parvula]
MVDGAGRVAQATGLPALPANLQRAVDDVAALPQVAANIPVGAIVRSKVRQLEGAVGEGQLLNGVAVAGEQVLAGNGLAANALQAAGAIQNAAINPVDDLAANGGAVGAALAADGLAAGIVDTVDAAQPDLLAAPIPLGTVRSIVANRPLSGGASVAPSLESASIAPAEEAFVESAPVESAEAFAAISNADLVLEDLQLAANATAIAGPAYRVQFRNQGSAPARDFYVAVLAGIAATPTEDAPRAVLHVASVAPGEAVEAVLRLPATAMRMTDASGARREDTFMPIVNEYRVPASVRAQAGYVAAGAAAQEDQRRYADQLGEQQRQFDLEYQFQQDQAALTNQLQRSQLDQQLYQFNANQSQNAYQFGAQNQLQWAGLNQNANRIAADIDLQQQGIDQNAWQVDREAQAREAQANAAVDAQRMKLAAQQQQKVEERNIAQAIRSQEAIMKFPFTSQAQFDAAINGWQQKFGIDWDFPKRAVAEQQVLDGEVRKQNFIDSWSQFTGLDASIISGMTVDTPSGPQLSVDPQVVTSMAKARIDDARLRDNKTNEIEAKTKSSEAMLQQKQAEARQKYDAEVNIAQGAVVARYHELLKEEAEALTDMGERDPATGKAFTALTLPDSVKLRLRQQAMQENPKPIAPVGLSDGL